MSAASGIRYSPWLTAPVVALAAFMEVLDLSIANVALPHIAGSLSASRDQSTWILTSYLVTNAIVLPISGWLSSVLGRKRFYGFCILGFGASSLLCGIAPSLELLILFRAVQGLTGGGLQPSSQAILADAFPPAQRGMAFAVYGMAVVLAPALGPTFGGWITDNYSWHWIFLVNVPVSIGLYFLVQVMIDDPPHVEAEQERRRQRRLQVDYVGFAFLALGLGCLQIVLDKGQEDDWFASSFIITMAVMSGMGLVAFVLRELRAEEPIVDLALFRNPSFATANLLMFMLGFILLGSTALLPQFVQALLGYTATDAGLVISPGGLLFMALMPISGRLTGRVDARLLIAFGLVVGAAGLMMMGRISLEVDYWTLAIARMVQVAGLAFLFVPVTSVAYEGIPRERTNNAAALINLSRNLGGSFGIALLSTSLARGSQTHQATLVEHVAVGDPGYLERVAVLQAHLVAQGTSPADALLQAQGIIARTLEGQAQTLAYIDCFRLLALIFIALLPVVLLLRSGTPARRAVPQAPR